jgi:hypothetical protein
MVKKKTMVEQHQVLKLYHPFDEPPVKANGVVKFQTEHLKNGLTGLADDEAKAAATPLLRKYQSDVGQAYVNAGYCSDDFMQAFEDLDGIDYGPLPENRLNGFSQADKTKIQLAVDCLQAMLEFSLNIATTLGWEKAHKVYAACVLASGINILNVNREITLSGKDWAVIDTVDSEDLMKLMASTAVSEYQNGCH